MMNSAVTLAETPRRCCGACGVGSGSTTALANSSGLPDESVSWGVIKSVDESGLCCGVDGSGDGEPTGIDTLSSTSVGALSSIDAFPPEGI